MKHPERVHREAILDLWQAGYDRREIAAQLKLPDDRASLNRLSDVIYMARKRHDPRADRTRWTPASDRPCRLVATPTDASLLCPELGIRKSVVQLKVLNDKSWEPRLVNVSVPHLRFLDERAAA